MTRILAPLSPAMMSPRNSQSMILRRSEHPKWLPCLNSKMWKLSWLLTTVQLPSRTKHTDLIFESIGFPCLYMGGFIRILRNISCVIPFNSLSFCLLLTRLKKAPNAEALMIDMSLSSCTAADFFTCCCCISSLKKSEKFMSYRGRVFAFNAERGC